MNGTYLVILLCLAFTCVIASTIKFEGEKKRVCYFASWATYRPGSMKFDVENIDPFLCTHIIYGLAGLSSGKEIISLDPYNDLEENFGAMKRFTNLKQINSNLTALLAVGGFNEGSQKYSEMAKDPAKRRTFVESVLRFLPSQGFDGLDFNWLYPTIGSGSSPEDKENYVTLLNELRAELEPQGYLLTVGVSPDPTIIESAYDIPAISSAVDFINVETFNLIDSVANHTSHHVALYANPALDFGANLTRNTDYAIRYWIDNGADPAKLIIGMASYGVGWLLDDASNNGIYAPAHEPIPPTPIKRTAGVWGYNEICEVMKSEPGQWTDVTDEMYQVPYAYKERHWIGYDSHESVANKLRYAHEMGLGGGMMWIDTDDFNGTCSQGTYPLMRAFVLPPIGSVAQPGGGAQGWAM